MTAAAARWRLTSTGTAKQEELGPLRTPVQASYRTGTLRTAKYRSNNDPRRALIIYVYPYQERGNSRYWSMGLSSEMIAGRDPADLGGTLLWSSIRMWPLPQRHPTLSQAEDDAARVIELLAGGFAAMDGAYPGALPWLLDRDDLA